MDKKYNKEQELRQTIHDLCNKIGCKNCPEKYQDGTCRAVALQEEIDNIEHYEQRTIK